MVPLGTYHCPAGHALDLLAGPHPRAETDSTSAAANPREPAWCGTCQSYFWVEHNDSLILVRNAMLDPPTLDHMADLLAARGKVEQAEGLLRKSLRMGQRSPDPDARARSLCRLSGLVAVQGRAEEARDLLRGALEAAERVRADDARAALLHDLAHLLADRGETEEALELYLRALALRERLGRTEAVAATLHEIAALRARRGQVDDAMWLSREALAMRKLLGDVRGQALTLGQMAGIHAIRGQVKRALKVYKEALRFWEKAHDLHGEARCLYDLGSLLAVAGKVEEATKVLRVALAIHRQTGNAHGVATVLRRTARLLATGGKIEGALRFLRKAMSIDERIGHVRGQAATLQEMAQQLAVRGRGEEALGHYRQALELAEKIGDVRIQATALTGIAQLTFSTAPDEAFALLGRAERVLLPGGPGRDLLGVLQAHAAVAKAVEDDGEYAFATANLVHAHFELGDPERAAEMCVRLARRLPPERRALAERLVSFGLLVGERTERGTVIRQLAEAVAQQLQVPLDDLRRRTPEVSSFVASAGALSWVEAELAPWRLATSTPTLAAEDGDAGLEAQTA